MASIITIITMITMIIDQYHGNADVDLSRECSSCKKNWAWVEFLGINAKNDLFCVIRRIQARVIVCRFSQNNWS